MVETLNFPEVKQSKSLADELDLILAFFIKHADLAKHFDRFKKHLTPDGKLWIAWPKARGLGTDLNLPEVVKVAYARGMVENVNLIINPVWTALKFTFPKTGKVYRNSHAELVRDDDMFVA